MLLAAKHINNGDCSVLGPDCAALLATGSYGNKSHGRLQIQPLLQNVNIFDPQAIPKAVQACTAATDAEILVGPLLSEQATQVASFIGGLGVPPTT
jgi:hypothetical protein